ncbi:MAG TPA: CoA pyrophosphatase [Lacipirellulaceae bacterium]|jgi:8-oxo-dGTP pyrophosphatase MutT (NUDIX family)|nr:CoA pyrophosphatase [Lacipirellulaceae bacterium]
MSSIESKIAALATTGDLPQRLAEALRAGHRGENARERMSPQLSFGRHAGPAPSTARAAAVILLLFRRDGRWHLPLTERPMTLAHHAGQISLPGGALDAGESTSAAAIRELSEELGVNSSVELLGQLADCYVFASDYLITPWVAWTKFEPTWRPHVHEVQDVIELPLETLLDDGAIGSVTIERGPLVFHAPCLKVGRARVWGATSTILSELSGVLDYLLENS